MTSMEALACEVPVFSTNTGRVAEVLSYYNKGIIVRVKDYKQWKNCLIQFIEGRSVEILDRETAYEYFAWPLVARKFIHVYQHVLNSNQNSGSGDKSH